MDTAVRQKWDLTLGLRALKNYTFNQMFNIFTCPVWVTLSSGNSRLFIMSDPEDADREMDTILPKTGATLLLSKEDILTF